MILRAEKKKKTVETITFNLLVFIYLFRVCHFNYIFNISCDPFSALPIQSAKP